MSNDFIPHRPPDDPDELDAGLVALITSAWQIGWMPGDLLAMVDHDLRPSAVRLVAALILREHDVQAYGDRLSPRWQIQLAHVERSGGRRRASRCRSPSGLAHRPARAVVPVGPPARAAAAGSSSRRGRPVGPTSRWQRAFVADRGIGRRPPEEGARPAGQGRIEPIRGGGRGVHRQGTAADHRPLTRRRAAKRRRALARTKAPTRFGWPSSGPTTARSSICCAWSRGRTGRKPSFTTGSAWPRSSATPSISRRPNSCSRRSWCSRRGRCYATDRPPTATANRPRGRSDGPSWSGLPGESTSA